MNSYIKIPAKLNPDVTLKVISGHFATAHSHISSYMDITTMKTRCSEAHGVASLLAQHYSISLPVDTIVCLDGTEIIGAFLAEELTKTGVLSFNAHKTIYVISPEYTAAGQIIFRDNLQMAIRDKHVLILCGSVTTGGSLSTALECLQYYSAKLTGACAVFSALDRLGAVPIVAAFHPDDVPGYQSYSHADCPMCKAGKKIDALVNSFGYSVL